MYLCVYVDICTCVVVHVDSQTKQHIIFLVENYVKLGMFIIEGA
jgi:hypothetical protein